MAYDRTTVHERRPLSARVFGRFGGAVLRIRADESGKLVRSRGVPRVVRHHPSGRLIIGDRVQLERGATFILHADAQIEIGDRVYVNDRVRIEAVQSVRIGKGTLLGNEVVITDSDLHVLDGRVDTRPVVIGNHVWIGMRAIVLRGVELGNGAVVAAGSVVTRSVDPGTLVAGVPARPVRSNVTWSPRRPPLARLDRENRCKP